MSYVKDTLKQIENGEGIQEPPAQNDSDTGETEVLRNFDGTKTENFNLNES